MAGIALMRSAAGARGLRGAAIVMAMLGPSPSWPATSAWSGAGAATLASYRRDLAGADTVPLGPIVCISPWNFPLAIFMGQISAALAAGNCVIAKPAEQTNLVGFAAVKLLHEGFEQGAVENKFEWGGDLGAPAQAAALVHSMAAAIRAAHRGSRRRNLRAPARAVGAAHLRRAGNR